MSLLILIPLPHRENWGQQVKYQSYNTHCAHSYLGAPSPDDFDEIEYKSPAAKIIERPRRSFTTFVSFGPWRRALFTASVTDAVDTADWYGWYGG